MSEREKDAEPTMLSPDDAFAVLGNETRMEILRTLGEADGALSFSELRDRVGMRDSGQFNYHLDKVQDHFVTLTDDGYRLRQAGNRVIQAVLSGALTEAPVLEPTEIDSPCIYCGASTVVSVREGHVRHYCSECSGTYGTATLPPVSSGENGTREQVEDDELGYLGGMVFPPAGIQGRTPTEVFEAGFLWATLELLATGRGVCPRCSAPIERSLRICEEHDTGGRVCERCGNRHAVICRARCPNCTQSSHVPFVLLCLSDPDVLAFVTDHGLDPLQEWSALEWTEEVERTDPFEAQFACSIDDDVLGFTVDDSLEVVEVTRNRNR